MLRPKLWIGWSKGKSREFSSPRLLDSNERLTNVQFNLNTGRPIGAPPAPPDASRCRPALPGDCSCLSFRLTNPAS